MSKIAAFTAATAAVVITFASPDFGATPSLMKEAQAASAADHYRNSIDQAPITPAPRRKFEKAPNRRSPTVPNAPSNTLGSPFIDLVGEYFNPQIQEGVEGSHYCSNEYSHHERSRHVQIIVRNKGTNAATQIRVEFDFSGQKLSHTIPFLQANSVKGSAVAIPDSAWQYGKAEFTIRIDHPNQVNETNEANNTYSSFCSDPN